MWEATVGDRTDGRGCPFCSGRAVCQHNTLARKAPQVALFWDAKKNYPLSPDQVTVSSNMKVHWKCSTCLHKWQASVFNKARGKTGCPKCAKANGGRKADRTRQKHPTFAMAQHALLQQWDHDRNRKNGNFPDNTTLQSCKLIWWQCQECPRGKVHSWQARTDSRTSCKKPTGCPCCAGHQLCDCNSLETVCPDIAADFDVERNGVTAAEVTSSAGAKFSWLSDGLEPRSGLWISALGLQGKKCAMMLGARKYGANSYAFGVFKVLASLTYCQCGTSLFMTVLCIEIWKDRGILHLVLSPGLTISKLYFGPFL